MFSGGFFGHDAGRIPAPQTGIELTTPCPAPPSTLEGEILTTGPPGKSQTSIKKKKPDKNKDNLKINNRNYSIALTFRLNRLLFTKN